MARVHELLDLKSETWSKSKSHFSSPSTYIYWWLKRDAFPKFLQESCCPRGVRIVNSRCSVTVGWCFRQTAGLTSWFPLANISLYSWAVWGYSVMYICNVINFFSDRKEDRDFIKIGWNIVRFFFFKSNFWKTFSAKSPVWHLYEEKAMFL